MSDRGPLGAASTRELAASLDLRPTKRWGQNFVVDTNTVRRIARAADVGCGDCVLEVGPGLGSLTLALLERGCDVVSVEIDAVLADALPQTVARRAPEQAARLSVVHGDAMDVVGLLGRRQCCHPDHLVANLPYNVAVPIVLTVLAGLPTVRRALVMVQAEVAHRMVARPGSRTYGVPSVKLAWFGEATLAGSVPRTVFWPAPNVDSALVRISRQEPPTGTVGRDEVFSVIDAAFSQRRKMLRSSLAALAGDVQTAEEALLRAGLDPRARAEDVDVGGYAAVAAALAER